MSTPTGTNAWSLQCSQCLRFLDWSVVLRLDDQDQPCHYDAIEQALCGPVERVELKSDG